MWTLLAATAFADPAGACTEGGLETGFASVSPRAGQLGSGFRPCARDAVGLTLGGALVVDADNFYGNIAGGATVDGSKQLGRWRVHGSVELLRADLLISAFSDTKLGLGHTMVGVQRELVASNKLVVTADSRVVLPTATALYEHARPLAIDLGVGLDLAATPWLRVHGHLAGLGSVALSAGPAAPWGGLDARVGAEARAGKVVALVVDADVTYGWTGGGALEAVVVAPGLRFGLGDLGIEVSGWVPLVATGRQPMAVSMRPSWRF
jgi:hypothetical protein